jgi:hypothetical protein
MLRGAIYVRLSIDDKGLARPLSHVSAGRADQLIAEDRHRTFSPCRQRHARALNNAALATLIAAASKRKAIVDDDCAKRAIAELTQECASPSASPPITSAAGAAHTCLWSCLPPQRLGPRPLLLRLRQRRRRPRQARRLAGHKPARRHPRRPSTAGLSTKLANHDRLAAPGRPRRSSPHLQASRLTPTRVLPPYSRYQRMVARITSAGQR